MLTIMLALTSFAQIHQFEKIVGKATTISQDNFKDIYKLNFITSNFEENNLIFNESENSELETESNLFFSYSNPFNFLLSHKESEPFADFSNTNISSQSIPLYDLFCNWKLHIS